MDIGAIWNMIIINPMVNTLLFIYSLVGNFGIAIILFTLVIRLITHPLTVQQMKGTAKMQEMQNSKEWQATQKKYKDDKQKLQQEQMKLYQEMGINPLGSCLPLVIQFPIIIGLYQAIIRVLAVSPLQLSQLYANIYPFIDTSKLLPVNNNFLWMNLSQPERFYIFGIGIPVLAILVMITTYHAIEADDAAPTTRPAGRPDDTGDELIHALIDGLPGLFFCIRVVLILHYQQCGVDYPICING